MLILTNLEFESEDVEMPVEEHEEIEEEENETEHNTEESENNVTDLDEDRSRSLLKRTEQMREWRRPSRVVRRSNKSNKGVKRRRFMEV